MIPQSFSRLLTVRVAGLIASFAVAGSATAADPPVSVAPGGAFAAPAVVGCSTCPGGVRCGPLLHKRCQPYVPQLSPGACFGYFQTQWHRWDDVCPIPYQGVTPVPAPATPPTIPIVPPTPMDPKGKGNEAPPPQPVKSSKVPLPPAGSPVKSAPAPLPLPVKASSAVPPLNAVPTVSGPLPPPPGYDGRR